MKKKTHKATSDGCCPNHPRPILATAHDVRRLTTCRVCKGWYLRRKKS